jgi:hypothetical protein
LASEHWTNNTATAGARSVVMDLINQSGGEITERKLSILNERSKSVLPALSPRKVVNPEETDL